MATQAMNTYGFEYDKLGRLKNTLHYSAAATTPTNSYTERGITYDLNGNITTLKRYAASEATPEDDYQYIYTGNKLTQIAGTDNNATISDATYTYDSNGNLTHDGLKNLQISYNFLNLPSVVTQGDTPVAEYSWFADGSKYRVLTQQNNGYIYTGSLIYASNNGNLQIESTDFAGGRINLVENTSTNALSQDIHYFHTDHLGSVRAITNQGGSVVEQNAYYPFGSRHTFGNTYAQTTNRFKFNGKEEQTTGNLQYLDYGARMYDANIGRWMVQDPLSEKYYAYSQYSFSGNNPILNIDSDGKAWDTFIDAAFLIYDLGSALYNHIIGEHSRAKQNWKDVGIDAASMIIPGVAAPMMKGLGKVAAETIETANKLDNVAETGKVIENTTNIGKYEHIPSPENNAPGKSTTRKQRQKLLEENMRLNDGILRSDGDGRILNFPSKNIKGQKADMNQAEVDHIIPKSKGGSNHNSNLQILSKEENLRKRNKY